MDKFELRPIEGAWDRAAENSKTTGFSRGRSRAGSNKSGWFCLAARWCLLAHRQRRRRGCGNEGISGKSPRDQPNARRIISAVFYGKRRLVAGRRRIIRKSIIHWPG